MELLNLVVNKECAKEETIGPGNVMKLTLTEETEDRELHVLLYFMTFQYKCQCVHRRRNFSKDRRSKSKKNNN
jgi:hypothetical protein